MSEDDNEIKYVPYREGEAPPGPAYIRARMEHEDGHIEEVWVLPESLNDGPIRHEDVDEFVNVLRWQYRHVGKLVGSRSFEDWELGFMRDANPEKEIAIWTAMTYAFLEFSQRNPGINKEAIIQSVLACVNGQEEKVRPKSVVPKLKKLLKIVPPELADLDNFREDGSLKIDAKHLR